MKQYGGWFFPDHEQHLTEWLGKMNDNRDGRLRYQGKKQDAALPWCKELRGAVDIGAHVGLWSYYLSKTFFHVDAFEPVSAHRECFRANVINRNVVLHDCAIGDREGMVSLHIGDGSSGDSWIDGEGAIAMKRLDDFTLTEVDFIKLDCEGYELFALRGGEETIKRCRPCIIVEQKPGRAQKFGLGETDAVDYLKSLGAVLRKVMAGDYILSWP